MSLTTMYLHLNELFDTMHLLLTYMFLHIFTYFINVYVVFMFENTVITSVIHFCSYIYPLVKSDITCHRFRVQTLRSHKKTTKGANIHSQCDIILPKKYFNTNP